MGKIVPLRADSAGAAPVYQAGQRIYTFGTILKNGIGSAAASAYPVFP
jgi:hypothetical protein